MKQRTTASRAAVFVLCVLIAAGVQLLGAEVFTGEANLVSSVADETQSAPNNDALPTVDLADGVVPAMLSDEEVSTESRPLVQDDDGDSDRSALNPELAQFPAPIEAQTESLALNGPFTGDAEVDFNPATNDGVQVIADPGGVTDAGVPAELFGQVSGVDIKDVRFYYDESADELFFAINFEGIGGDPDGDQNVATGDVTDPNDPTRVLGVDEPRWIDEAFSVILDVDADGVPDIIAGVSDDAEIGEFVLSQANPGLALLVPGDDRAYADPIADGVGIAPVDTSTTAPDIEFSIANFSSFFSGPQDDLGIYAFSAAPAFDGIPADSLPQLPEFVVVANPAADVLADPPAVELEPGIAVELSIDGNNADEPDGDVPVLVVGSTVIFDAIVTNTGELPLTNIVVNDSALGALACESNTLAVAASLTCQISTTVTAGETTNTVSASAQPVDVDGTPFGGVVTDSDPASHIGATASISLEKFTNGEDADDLGGPEIETGDDVTFTYVVSNDGTAALRNVAVTDDIEGQVCTIANLAPGASETCELVTTAGVGAYVNVGRATGRPVDADREPIAGRVAAQDVSHHVGVCSNFVDGPVLHQGGETIWDTGLVVPDGSVLVLTTSENGGSPGQPNEQVYVEVADVLYGPSPIGLGTIPFDIDDGGAVRVLHISEVDTDITGANSVVPSLCGEFATPAAAIVAGPNSIACTAPEAGARLHHGGQTVWESDLVATVGSEITITTSDSISQERQANEQVYIQIGDVLYGPTPAGLGVATFEITNTGLVTVVHHSVVTGDTSSPNSVEFTICGTDLERS